MGSRWSETDAPKGDEYDARWAAMAARGENPHGEVDFVESLEPEGSVLDAGCGTGRVAIELARRGHDVVGVDLDETMLATARANAPDLSWVQADLTTVDLGRTFDAVVLAGNVMIFVAPGSEQQVVARAATHLRSGGHLVAGFQLRTGGYDVAAYDADCEAAGLVPVARHATWQGDPWTAGGDYAVSVHRAAT